MRLRNRSKPNLEAEYQVHVKELSDRLGRDLEWVRERLERGGLAELFREHFSRRIR